MTIKQFDIFANPIRASREERPYLISLQDYSLNHLVTRVVAPLVTERVIREESRLNPKFNVAGKSFYFLPYDLFAVPARLLRASIANLQSERYRIIAALDLVLTGV